MAILAGDALLNLAYETASKAFELEPANPVVGTFFFLAYCRFHHRTADG